MAEETRERVKFETIKSDEIKFGTRNFLEIARKKAITKEGENEFVSISRGFYAGDQRMYKKNVSVPVEKEILEFISKKILEM